MKVFENHPQWSSVIEVCRKLHDRGYQVWLAGGCVRDFLLQISPKDFDVVTNALPDEIQGVFPNSLEIGKQFGIIIVPFEGFQIEIATFRSDGQYEDGRHPKGVTFSTPEEDAKRRDFTINALFLDPFTEEIHDFVQGKKDLDLKLIRAVGEAQKRFEEDKLRLLRAVRFSAQLEFKIEENTLDAIQKSSSKIGVVSKERIYHEFSSLMKSKGLLTGLLYLKESRLYGALFHPFRRFGDLDTKLNKSIKFLTNHKDMDEITKWSLFFHPYYENTFNSMGEIESFLYEFKFPKTLIQNISKNFLNLKWMETYWGHRKGVVLEFIHSIAGKQFVKYYAELPHNSEELKKLEDIILIKTNFPQVASPLVDGNDLIQKGIAPGPEMKTLLKEVYYYQLENNILKKEDLLKWLLDKKK